jgi:DNA-binding transcriptional regulator YiaG
MPMVAKRRSTADVRPKWDAAKVRALRLHIGLTQQAFAKKIGVRQQTVSDWEKGVNRPRGASLTLLNMIAEQTGFRYELESQKK